MNAKLMMVDDHPMMRHGLREAVARQPNLTLVGEAWTGAMALKLARELTPDLVVMDVHLPDINGIETSRQLLSSLPALKIVIFSDDTARQSVDEALQAGVCGYLSKMSAVAELMHAIDLVMQGKLYLSPEVSGGILEDYRKGLAEGCELSKSFLSQREKQLMRLVAEGKRNKE